MGSLHDVTHDFSVPDPPMTSDTIMSDFICTHIHES